MTTINHTRQAEPPEPSLDLEALHGRLTCSVDEAADILGIGRSTAYAAVKDGSLPTLRISNRILVPVAKLRLLLGLEEPQ